MSDSRDSLLARFRRELFSRQSLVILVAIVVAVPVAGALYEYTGDFAAGFLLLVLLGVEVPSTYERRWPIAYESTVAIVAWTLGACALVAGAFLALYLAASAFLSRPLGAVVAFVLATVAEIAVARRVGGQNW